MWAGIGGVNDDYPGAMGAEQHDPPSESVPRITNAAAERVRDVALRLSDWNYVCNEFRGTLSDNYSREDRRRLVALPRADADEYVEQFKSWFSLLDGAPTFSIEEIIAVRGDRLVAYRGRTTYADGSYSDINAVLLADEAVAQADREIQFDVDDVSSLMAEVDRLDREIQAQG